MPDSGCFKTNKKAHRKQTFYLIRTQGQSFVSIRSTQNQHNGHFCTIQKNKKKSII